MIREALDREDNKPAAQTLEIRIFILRRLELKESHAPATFLGRFAPLLRRRGRLLVTQLRAGRRGVDGWLWRFRRVQAAEDSSGEGCSDLVASASQVLQLERA